MIRAESGMKESEKIEGGSKKIGTADCGRGSCDGDDDDETERSMRGKVADCDGVGGGDADYCASP